MAWQLSPNHSTSRVALNKVEGILYDVRFNLVQKIVKPQLNQTSNSSELPSQNTSSSELSQDKIIIIDIDEKSIAEQGRFPWSRNKMATLLENLFESQVAVVAFDIMFSEPENNPVQQILSQYPSDAELQKQLKPLINPFDADANFAKALTKGDTVLAMLLDDSTGSKSETVVSAVTLTSDMNANQTTVMNKAYIRSTFSSLTQHSKNTPFYQGFINSTPDDDGSIRRAALLLRHQQTLYPSLALEAVRAYSFEPEIKVRTEFSEKRSHITGIELNQQSIATDLYGRIWVPYQAGQGYFKYISATDIIEKRVMKSELAGAIAFVGTSAVGLADLKETPVGMNYPGVEIHASVAYGLLNPEILLTELDTSDAIMALFLLFLGLMLSFLLHKLGPVMMSLVGVFCLLGCVIINLYFWIIWQLVFPLTSSLLIVLSITILNVIAGYIAESRQKNRIKNYFQQYVPAAHINKILENPNAVNFDGERKNMTVLFADIRGFTQISEQLTANQVKQLLNDYLSPITKIILDNQGTIDKYVGDMVMAFWGAPVDDEKHAEHAVAAALQMLEKCQQLNKNFAKKGWPQIEIGIGINSGEMNVGDMGSEFRRAYTVIGDAVNLASRLESITKFYGVNMLVSENTYRLNKGYLFQLVDKVKVKGKQQAINIYQPQPNQIDVQLHEQAFSAYFLQDWPKAKMLFSKLAKLHPDKKLYPLYVERIQALTGNTQADWDGCFTHQQK